MKKSLLALGALSGTAMGQTGVTLYGRVDAGIGVADSDASGGDETVMLWSGVESATRIGIRGSEDLGSGLQVTFNIETGIEGDTGESSDATGEADDVSRPSGDGDMYGLSGVYENGPLTTQAYYQSRKFDNGLNDTDRVDEYGAGAQYRFGAYRVAVGYGMADTGLPGGGSVKHDAWSIGLGARLGVGEVLFNYVAQKVDLAGDPRATSFGIAYVHPVSKRTNFYVSYGQLDNDHGADFTLRASASRTAVGGTANAEPKAFAVGILHNF